MTSSFTPAQLEQLRRNARRLARLEGIPLHEAQDRTAKAKGFQNWSILAKHVIAKPVLATPSRQLVGERYRYYLHGDQQEGNPAHFYCKECDVFAEAVHFSEAHRTPHAERALDHIELFRKRPDYYPSRAYRRSNAPNLFTSEMAQLAEARKIREASRSPFYRWLCDQEMRNDPVGDLAYDIKRDKPFPVEASVRKMRTYLKQERMVAPFILVALHRAWTEFSATKKA